MVPSMILAAVCLAACAVVTQAANPTYGSWQQFKAEHGKEYGSQEEEAARFKIFQERLATIEKHNAKSHKSFELGVNHLVDLKHEEYMKMNGLRRSANKPKVNHSFIKNMLSLDPSPVPESVDWSKNPERVGPVKNQGQCGSCWAFATVGMLEGQENKQSSGKNVTQLSEQNLLDCDVDGNDHGCQGGDLTDPLEFVHRLGGLDTEAEYPYLSGKGEDDFDCLYDLYGKPFATTRNIKGAQQLTEGDEEQLKKFVAKYGPVASAMDASLDSFQMYRSGIYYDKHCSSANLNHAILVVGYGTDKEHGDYWIVKNSWSEKWGEKGYFKLARNRNNSCGIATMPTIAI